MPGLESSCRPFLATSGRAEHSAHCLGGKLLLCSDSYSWWHLQITREEGLMYVFVLPGKMAMNFMLRGAYYYLAMRLFSTRLGNRCFLIH